jgi:mRNA interferase MazF
MVEIELTQGGVYLARLNPAKEAEVGKVRPVVVLTTQLLLQHRAPIVFICPLSSQSYPEFESLHIKLPARDGLQVASYALTEHCRSIAIQRIIQPRIAQLSLHEIKLITSCLSVMVSIEP